MLRQSQIQEYFDQEFVRPAQGGAEVNLFLAGSPGNGLAVKVPRGPQPKMHRTIRRHTTMQRIGGGLVIPFEHLDKLDITPTVADDP